MHGGRQGLRKIEKMSRTDGKPMQKKWIRTALVCTRWPDCIDRQLLLIAYLMEVI